MFLGMIARPNYDGFLGILGWIVAIIMGSAPLFCGLGLGLSAALRKKGRSRQSFAVQFSGVLGIAISLILCFLFYDNLLRPLN
jgi:Na+-driven multidrug efflux pump